MRETLARIAIGLALFLVTGVVGYGMGYKDGAATRPAAVVKAAKQEAVKTTAKVKAGDTVAAASARQDAERAQTDKVVTRWIVKYVKADASAPALGDNWLRGHDGAALGADPGTLVPSAVPGAAAQPDDAEVLATVASNYSLAHFFRDRYHSCRIQLASELGKPPEWVQENLPDP